MWQDNNGIYVEGWVPSPVEQSLIDGTFDELYADQDDEPVPDDMLEFEDFHEAMEELRSELEDPSLIPDEDCSGHPDMGELPYISDEELDEIFLPAGELAAMALRDFDEQLALDDYQ